MRPEDVVRARTAAVALAADLGLPAEESVVLHDSNKLALRLLPCDVVARVAHRGQEVAATEVAIARRLAAAGAPVAALEPRVAPRPYERDGFVVTLWTHHAPVAGGVPPAEVAAALERLHAGMRTLDVAVPHFTDRVAEARAIVASPEVSPELAEGDRARVLETLDGTERAILDRSAPEQLVHGEPHPGNVLGTATGVRFIDLETCCRGPVELDLAHVPEPISRCYPGVDEDLLQECRALVLAMVAAWRFEPGDQLPDRARAAEALLAGLRAGPPWEPLDAVMRRAGFP